MSRAEPRPTGAPHSPPKSRLDVDRTTFRLTDGQLRIDGQAEPMEATSLVALEAMVQAALRQKRKEMRSTPPCGPVTR